MSDVFQEVDEDIRQQEMSALWNRFGPWVVGAAVVAIAITSGFMYWRNHQETVLSDASEQLLNAIELLITNENSEAATEFAALAETGPKGYATLALFQQAAAVRLDGDFGGAVALYDQLAADNDVEEILRDLARLFGGLASIESSEFGYDETEFRLSPVATGTSPWRYHALEGLGFAAYASGQFDAASEYYRQITDDGLAPEAIVVRANEMLNMTEAAASAASE